MPYWRLHYHLVWTTLERGRLIDPRRERLITQILYRKARQLDLTLHATGGMEDHIHIVASVPPKIALAECLRQLKGASSYAVNQALGHQPKFEWQDGYGALTLDSQSFPAVLAYVRNQRQHHRNGTTDTILEQTTERAGPQPLPAEPPESPFSGL